MSVVTTMVAVPNRIEAVVHHLQGTGREADVALRQLLSPPTLNAGENVATGVIDECRRLGLIERDGDGNWRATRDAAKPEDTREWVASILLNPQTAMLAGQPRVGPAIAWFLSRDTRMPLRVGENWRALVERDCPTAEEAFDLTNPDRCRQFVYWVVYLGFGWRLGTGVRDARQAIVPDPTVAIESALRATLEPGEELPIAEVMTRVAQACPVIEGGSVRQEIEQLLAAERQRAVGQLSQSTSAALSRLESRGVIVLPPPASDARVMTLNLWPQPRYISLLRLLDRGG